MKQFKIKKTINGHLFDKQLTIMRYLDECEDGLPNPVIPELKLKDGRNRQNKKIHCKASYY